MLRGVYERSEAAKKEKLGVNHSNQTDEIMGGIPMRKVKSPEVVKAQQAG